MQDPNIKENLYDYALIDFGKVSPFETPVEFLESHDYSKYKKHKLSKREAWNKNQGFQLNNVTKRFIKV
tara:strand:- start:2154 stop:2360 length:207 start_codon:yes stop_codon:yes gene_type:complete